MVSFRAFSVPIDIRALGTATVYYVETGSGKYLVDSGMKPGTLHILEKHGIPVSDLNMIILTHLHIDHIGGAMEIRRRYNTPIMIGKEDYRIIEDMTGDPESFTGRMRDFYLSNGSDRDLLISMLDNHPVTRSIQIYREMEFDFTPHGDHMINGENELRIMATPGHSPGSMSPYVQGDMIFSGDHILPRITPNISFYVNGGNMLSMYIRSLEKVRSHHFRSYNPGHGNPSHDTDMRINEILEHHEKRLSEVTNIISSGKKNALDVAMEMTWSRKRKFSDLNLHEMNFAFGEAVAHLRYLESIGKAEASDVNGIILYSSSSEI